jgi:acyl carrier protein
MKKKIFLIELAKVFKKKKLNSGDSISELDSLNFLELMEFSNTNFKDFDFPIDNYKKCKTINDLIKLYGNRIN